MSQPPVRETFPDEWSDPRTYLIATNRGISAFLKLLRSILDLHAAPLSHAEAKEYLAPLKKRWGDWTTANLKNKYVGSAGWKQFHRELVEAIKKDFPGLKA